MNEEVFHFRWICFSKKMLIFIIQFIFFFLLLHLSSKFLKIKNFPAPVKHYVIGCELLSTKKHRQLLCGRGTDLYSLNYESKNQLLTRVFLVTINERCWLLPSNNAELHMLNTLRMLLLYTYVCNVAHAIRMVSW